MRKAAIYNTSKTFDGKSYMLLTYADDVDIIGRTIGEDTAVFAKIEKESV